MDDRPTTVGTFRSFVLVIAFSLLFLLVYFGWNYFSDRSEFHAKQTELRALYDRWNEAGRPGGEELARFMKGRGHSTIDQEFFIGGTNYTARFAWGRNLQANNILVITTNKVLLLIGPDRTAEIAPFQ